MTQPPTNLHGHTPVLLRQVTELLSPAPGQIYADATAGLGGHALAVGRLLAPGGTVILNDVDPGNLDRAKAALEGAFGGSPQVKALRGNFADLPRRLDELTLRVDMVLADLGFSSSQMDDPVRGFSFMRDGPLDMRLDPSLRITASDLVGSMSERELADLITEFGEDRHAARIARKLVQARAQSPITTTSRLASVVRSACGPAGRGQGIDPATKTFQALRIAVNDELGTLEAFLSMIRQGAERVKGTGSGPNWLNPGARVGIISFHSLEDRPVKRCFGELASSGLGVELTPTPVTADESEVTVNPRSRSAKLRVIRVNAG